MGLGLNKIPFDGILFKILKKMVCPSERDKKEENIQGPPWPLSLTLILIENQMGCLIAFSLSKPCKEGKGNKKDGGSVSLFHSLR